MNGPMNGAARVLAQNAVAAAKPHPLEALAHALFGMPQHAFNAWMQAEHNRNQYQRLQEQLALNVNRQRAAPWAWSMLHNPTWQTRQYIHPRGG